MALLRDTWLIFVHQLRLTVRRPMFLLFGLVQPITYLVIFAPFLLPALAKSGATHYGDAYRVYVPGLLVAICLFGGLFAGFGLLADLHNGVIERCRVTPVSRAALLLGRSLRDVVTMLAQAVVITVLALPFGLRVSLGYLLVAYLLLALLALATTALSYDVTLLIRDAATLGQVINSVSQPVGLLAGVLVPIALAPAWIQSVSWWIPFSWATKGMRALFNGNLGDPSVWQGMTVVLVLAVASVAWSTYLFRRSVR